MESSFFCIRFCFFSQSGMQTIKTLHKDGEHTCAMIIIVKSCLVFFKECIFFFLTDNTRGKVFFFTWHLLHFVYKKKVACSLFHQSKCKDIFFLSSGSLYSEYVIYSYNHKLVLYRFSTGLKKHHLALGENNDVFSEQSSPAHLCLNQLFSFGFQTFKIFSSLNVTEKVMVPLGFTPGSCSCAIHVGWCLKPTVTV